MHTILGIIGNNLSQKFGDSETSQDYELYHTSNAQESSHESTVIYSNSAYWGSMN